MCYILTHSHFVITCTHHVKIISKLSLVIMMCIILNVLNEPHMHVLASLFIYNDSFFSIPYLKNGTLTWSTFKLNRSRDKESSVLKVTEHKASNPWVWSWSSPAWQSAEKQPWFVATVRKCIFLLQKKHTTVAPWWPWVQAPTMNHNIPIRIWLRTFVACHPPPLSLSLISCPISRSRKRMHWHPCSLWIQQCDASAKL